MSVSIRRGSADDLPVYRRVLYDALDWDPDETIPPPQVVLDHPEVLRYHEGWGRRGDLGVVAESAGEVVGAAYCRLFTDDDHGHGFVDPATPELAIAVWDGHRGQGIGAGLVGALEEALVEAGFDSLSLSTALRNPALRLYERLGFEVVRRDDDAVIMLKLLGTDLRRPR